MNPLLSVCNDNYAYYDKEEHKILFGFDNKIGGISLPKGKKCTSLCITEDKLCFILDRSLFVRGDLYQSIDRPEFRSVHNLPTGKSWHSILYVSKQNVKQIILIAGEPENFEIFYEYEGRTWINVTPNERDIIDKLPDSDYESSVYIFKRGHIGVFDNAKKTVVWQKVQLPDEIQSFAVGKNNIYFTVNEGVDEKNLPIINLYCADIKKLLNDESDATKRIAENLLIHCLYAFNDALIFLILNFSKNLFIYDKGSFQSVKLQNLDDDDSLICSTVFKNSLLFQTKTDRVFHAYFKEDLSGFMSFQEVTRMK